MKKMLFLTALFVGFGLAISYQPAQAAGCTPGNIVFSEIDYDQPDPENNFLELYFPNAATVTDCEIRLVNGGVAPPTVYRTATISGTYAAGSYICMGSAGDSILWNTSSCPGATGNNCIQDGQWGSTATISGTTGSADGFALVDTSTNSLVWFYSYEGIISGYDPGDGSSNTSTDLGVWDYPQVSNLSIINGPAPGGGDVTTTTNVTRCAANVDNSGPTAIALASLAASSQSSLGLVALLGVVLSSGVWVVLRRKKH